MSQSLQMAKFIPGRSWVVGITVLGGIRVIKITQQRDKIT